MARAAVGRLQDVLMIADIKAPDTPVVRQAEELVRALSSDTLFNHVMRCYWFGELFAQRIELGLHELTAGQHRLRFAAVDQNTVSAGSYFGLDAVELGVPE